nr:hypothetical protein CFP56_61623 [Quercus suber]
MKGGLDRNGECRKLICSKNGRNSPWVDRRTVGRQTVGHRTGGNSKAGSSDYGWSSNWCEGEGDLHPVLSCSVELGHN